MNLLDEHVRADQRLLLTRWRIPFRQIGKELGPAGIKDSEIIPFLLTLKRPTLFTHDQGFFSRHLVHTRYCLAWLNVSDIETAAYLRQFLSHPSFDSHLKRMGIVARVHHDGVTFWRCHRPRLQRVAWVRRP
jgi:hypothetical protein